MPTETSDDYVWLAVLTSVVELGGRLHQDVVVHTHFNHPAKSPV